MLYVAPPARTASLALSCEELEASGSAMVLPLPCGRSRRTCATSLLVAARRQQRRRRRRERRLLAPSRELFQRAHIVAQGGNAALAATLFKQCIGALPTRQPAKACPAATVIRAMALTQLGQLAEVPKPAQHAFFPAVRR